MHVTLDFISYRLVKLLGTQRKRELQNDEKLLPTVGLEPNTSRFKDWRSNQLDHGIAMIVSMYMYR